MLFVNNIIQPCLLCGQPVVKEGSFFCPQCSIFSDKERLQKAVDNYTEDTTPAQEDEYIDFYDDETIITFDEDYNE